MTEHGRAHGDGLRLEELVGLLRRRTWTVVLVAAASFLGVFAWVGASTPVYRASATVLIDGDGGEQSLLGELSVLGRAPAAASEIAILASRSIAEQVVRAPESDGVPMPGVAGYERHLGLATTVDDEALLPLATLARRLFGGSSGGGRLFAAVAERAAGAPEEVRVAFPEPGVVRLSVPGPLSLLGLDGGAETLPWEPGAALAYRGLVLRLAAEGDVLGRAFRVRHVTEDIAVRRLQEGTRVIETERDSGVVLVTVSDSDPERAARVADALCLNYFDLDVARGTRRASQTVEFIDGQLEAQSAALERAEAEVVDLREGDPETIDVSASAGALIQRLSDLEVERVQLDLVGAELGQALALLERGDTGALSRLSAEMADPVTAAYLEQISRLTTELELQERGDGGPYKLLLQRKLDELETASDELELRNDLLREVVRAYGEGDPKALSGLGGSEADGFGLGPLVGGYLERIAALEGERAELAQVYTPEFPRIVEIDAALTELRGRVLGQLAGRLEAQERLAADRRELCERTRRVLAEYPGEERAKLAKALESIRAQTGEHLRERSAGLDARRAALADELDGLEARLGALPEKERKLADPLRRLETHGEIVRFLLKSKQDAEIARAATVATADFIDPSVAPIRRYAPRLGFTLVMAALLGLAAGMFVAYLRERLRGSLHTEAELEEVSGMPVLGAIPDFRSSRFRHLRAAEGFLALRDDPEGPVAESYRSLRANLRFALGGSREIRTLAVTSCTPGEGKSTTNADLAIAFANGDKRVLLVDADMRKPTVHRNFSVERGPGLADVLTDGADWRSCVRPSGLAGLDLLTAGHHRGKPGDLLARPGIEGFVDELEAAYDVVVFDLPPALVVADVEIFAHKLDAILLLYRADGVSRDAVRSASARLRQTGSNLVGCVLNAVRASHGRGGAYYNTYYEYSGEGGRYRRGA